jgi:Zn-dependent M28 family amino/carboxypeptidase
VAAMHRAEDYVTRELQSAGWHVRRDSFTGAGTPGVNLLATAGSPGQATGGGLIVGAHLDTVPGSPGADDNASAVAALLELARLLPSLGLGDRVRLVVFDEEESGLHGSRALAGRLREDPPAAVVVLECVGYFSREAGTQRLPPGASLLFPGQYRRLRRRRWRGDFTLLAYRRSADRPVRLLAECLAHLRGPHAVMLARDPLDLPVAGPLLGRYVPVARHFARSDHRPFWDLGVPAVQVTDTADFRNPHYHRPTDTPETLDYGWIADIVAATALTLAALDRDRDAAVRRGRPPRSAAG